MKAALAALCLAAALPAAAGTLGALTRHTFTDYCSTTAAFDAAQQDRLLRFAAVVRREWQATGQAVALVSRTGTDLRRFGQRFSHAGVALREGAELPWAVRQLYYACDEQRPRLFDQGLAGFVLGSDNPRSGHVSLVVLPPGPQADALQRAALDKPLGLALVAPQYRANAHAFSSRYQNCNQWLAELLALAWRPAAPGLAPTGTALREAAQQALREAGYEPDRLPLGSHWLMWAAGFVPLLTLDDHPPEDRQALQMRVSMPRGLEQWVRRQVPQAQRIEICHAEGRLVIRHGWSDLPEGCTPEPGDTVEMLD
ncbi:MAG: DUF2145 domain-containing protein [Rubrivivax sp.]|nr:DUF2145 domain-containing protein [Rubrivivax sp.]